MAGVGLARVLGVLNALFNKLLSILRVVGDSYWSRRWRADALHFTLVVFLVGLVLGFRLIISLFSFLLLLGLLFFFSFFLFSVFTLLLFSLLLLLLLSFFVFLLSLLLGALMVKLFILGVAILEEALEPSNQLADKVRLLVVRVLLDLMAVLISHFKLDVLEHLLPQLVLQRLFLFSAQPLVDHLEECSLLAQL